MGLVKYIEKRGLGTVKSTSRFHADHEENNLVDQTQGASVQLENKSYVKTPGDVDFPATMLVDSLRGSESTCSKKRKNDMPKRSAKKLCNKILYSKSGESSNETEGGESDLVVLDRVESLAESVNKLLTKFKKKAEMEAHLRDQISRYRARMSLQNEKIVKLVKKVRKLKDPNTSALAKGREAIRMVAKNSVEHAKVVEALKKELAEGEEKLKQVHQQLEQEKEIIDKLKQVNEEKLNLVYEELEQEKKLVENLKQVNEEKLKQVLEKLEQEKEMVEKLKQVNEEKLKQVHGELEQEKEMVEKLKQVNEENLNQVHKELEQETEMREKFKQVNEEKLKQVHQELEQEKETVKKLKQVNEENLKQVHQQLEQEKEIVEILKQEILKRVHEELEHEKEIVETLKQVNDEKLKLVNEELEQKKEMVETLKQANDVEAWKLEVAEEEWRQERMRLENSLERVSSERKWLIEEGFDYVIKRLHRSQEYVEPLVVTKSFLWSAGAHYGVVKGYEACKEGRALEDHFLYEPEANEKFLNAVHIMKHTRFPYIATLSQCTNCSLDELRAVEPIGLEEVEDGNEDEVDGE